MKSMSDLFYLSGFNGFICSIEAGLGVEVHIYQRVLRRDLLPPDLRYAVVRHDFGDRCRAVDVIRGSVVHGCGG